MTRWSQYGCWIELQIAIQLPRELLKAAGDLGKLAALVVPVARDKRHAVRREQRDDADAVVLRLEYPFGTGGYVLPRRREHRLKELRRVAW